MGLIEDKPRDRPGLQGKLEGLIGLEGASVGRDSLDRKRPSPSGRSHLAVPGDLKII